MADDNITIAAKTIPWYGPASGVELWVYSSKPWVTAAGTPINTSSPYDHATRTQPYKKLACTVNAVAHTCAIEEKDISSTEDALVNNDVTLIAVFLDTSYALPRLLNGYSVFGGEHSAPAAFRVPDDPTSTTWEDLALNMSGPSGPIQPADRTVNNLTVLGDADVAGDGAFGGTVTALAFVGNGAGITGLAGATGGVANTGSTTVGADTDDNGVGVIDLQTRLLTRARVNNDGTFELFKPARLMGYTTGSLPGGAVRQLAYDTDRNRPVYHNGAGWLPVGEGLGFFNLKDYGAIGDGSNDDTAAIDAAIAACGAAGGGVVFVPPGDYSTTGGHVIDSDYVRIVGCGWASKISMSSASGNTLTFDNGVSGMPSPFMEDATFLTGCGVENVRFEPSVSRTSGSEIVAYRYNKLYLNDLIIHNAYQGILLGRTSDITITTYVQNLRMRTYKAFGIKCVNVIELFGDGWALDKYNQDNNTYSIWLSGLTSGFLLSNSDVVNGKVSDTGETANNVYALYIHNDTGLTGAVLLANQLSNCMFDSHSRGVVVTGGTGILFSNCFFSNRSVGTGGTPGIGVTIAGGTDVSLVNCYALNNGGPGYYLGGSGSISVIGGAVTGNNQQGYPNTDPYSAGIYLDIAAGGNVRIIGVSLNKNSTVFPSNLQQWGIWTTATAASFEISGNFLTGNHTGAINNLAGLSTSKRIHHNEGWVTENSGNSSVASGATSVAVTHGLSTTPAAGQIVVTPTNNPTNNVRHYVSAVTSTTFTVTTSGDPGAGGLTFGWSVKIQ